MYSASSSLPTTTTSTTTTMSVESQRPTSCILAAINASSMPSHIPEPLLEFLPSSTSAQDPDYLPSYRDVMAEERICPLPAYEPEERTIVYHIERRQARGTLTTSGTLPEGRQARRQLLEEVTSSRFVRESFTTNAPSAREGGDRARMLERQRRIKTTRAAELAMYGVDYQAQGMNYGLFQ